MVAVAITRKDISAAELRSAAKRASNCRHARRILAIAMVLDGYSRAEAAQACAMDRQSLRDWVHRYNEFGLKGLTDRPHSGRPASLTKCQQEEIEKWVEQGADLEQDGVVRFRCIDLRDRIAKRFGVSLHVRSVGKLLRKLEFRRLSVRSLHPKTDLAEQEAFRAYTPQANNRSTRHIDAHMGSTRHTPSCVARPAFQLGISVRRNLPCTRNW
jgi:transposase